MSLIVSDIFQKLMSLIHRQATMIEELRNDKIREAKVRLN